jgi:hypothetical protein
MSEKAKDIKKQKAKNPKSRKKGGAKCTSLSVSALPEGNKNQVFIPFGYLDASSRIASFTLYPSAMKLL